MNSLVNALKVVLMAFFISAVITLSISAGEISLSSRLNKSEMAFEEEATLIVELKWNGNVGGYSFELMPLPAAENLKVVGSSSTISTDLVDGENITTRTFKYNFQPTLAGTGRIFPIEFNYTAWPDSIPGQLTTQEFTILIANPIPQESMDSSISPAIYFIFAAIIIIGSGATVLIIKNRSRKAVDAETKISKELKFVKQLDDIKREHHSERKSFYAQLYKLLLWYLDEKYSMATAGKTVGTILNELNLRDIPAGQKERLSELLTKADKEKFAPTKGEPGDILRLCAELENYFMKIDDNNKTEA